MKKEVKKVETKKATDKKAAPKTTKQEKVVETKPMTNLEQIICEITKLNEAGKMALLNEKVLFIQNKSSAENVKAKALAAKELEVQLTDLYQKGLAENDLNATQYAICHGALPLTEDIYSTGIFAEYDEKLRALRENGEYEVGRLSDAIKTLYLKKNIDKEEKKSRINELKIKLKSAENIKKENAQQVKKLKIEASKIAKLYGKEIENFSKLVYKFEKCHAKQKCDEQLAEENKKFNETISKVDKNNAQFVKLQHQSNVSDIKREYIESYSKAKNAKYSSYLSKYNYYRVIRNNRLLPGQALEFFNRTYANNFTVGGFFLKNALYLVIIAFFIICAIVYAIQNNGASILTPSSIVNILGDSSTNIFFALGVAGLILLGGTDLSIGRMCGMAASLSCMFLSLGGTYKTIFGTITTPTSIPLAVILSLGVSLLCTVGFSALAGFFTSKFKMHPFITTLSTQLIIFGLMMVFFGQVSAFTMDSSIATQIAGEKNWKLIIYAAAIIVIIWFIWNKTKFGRHMYAVGDNQEAARVSGINVFWVTMGVFILAGICYGLGGFFQGAKLGNANPNVGAGSELDAIAACVIGGVSFSGGRGKISGVVAGTLIFTTLTSCLSTLGLDVNFQFIFKGLIILAAVCLDSLKFLKKK